MRHLYTAQLTFERLLQTGDGVLQQFLSVDGTDGARQVTACLLTIGNNDDFVERKALRAEHDGAHVRCLLIDVEVVGVVAHIIDFQLDRIFYTPSEIQLKLSVGISRCSNFRVTCQVDHYAW